MPFGSEPAKCTLGSFSKTWGLPVSKEIPKSDNSHVTARLQESWLGEKKIMLQACNKLGTADNIHIVGTQEPVVPGLFCLFMLRTTTITANVKPISIHSKYNTTAVISQ